MTPMTDEAINTLVQDMIVGLVFTSEQCALHDVPRVFMAFGLAMMSGELKKEDLADTAILYEYLDKASQRSYNGMPTFFSHHEISKADWPKVARKYNQVRAAMKEALATPT